MRRAAAVLAALAMVLGALVGCGQTPTAVGPRFQISEEPSGVWEPIHVRVVALPPGARVTVRAAAQVGADWTSQATYLVPASGIVDLDTEAPIEAPFTGPDGMGLFWSLGTASGASATSSQQWGGASVSIDLDALVDGRRVAARRIHRVGLTSVAPSRAVFDDGITGDFFEPRRSSPAPRPAVLVLDGTDPGAPTGVLAASTLAAMGYPALAFSTYGSAGELNVVRTLPAERVVAALNWLRSQPGVDGRRVTVFGTSRGAQLALWTAVAHPELVYGAIAPAGTTGLVCPSPVPGPAVTVGGAWVPCVSGTRDPTAASVLDLTRIRGPVVLGCAGQDEQLDDACEWMDAAAEVRPPHGGDAYVRAPDATHLFYVPPYTPLYLPPPPAAQATEDARVTLWSAIARALDVRGP
ncbi:acyl-CoA thioesterase/BAAT N-terminal domain-containing protein [Leifsonia shinshuensis]|uniref:acyl-CoA thioesterase/BAAT N-terminal domain-containing protein n=1 Tax=Leifsonia shinshuensis TaxID=150026 RepID=UPI002855FBA0|nr:acyl-CoA thioesterase/BAAT N-terminal domain-containing protein [Leifsonia shinshuensis]MDR6973125.1 acetyl esterase/lipase [Leifsonia shinshuensis]